MCFQPRHLLLAGTLLLMAACAQPTQAPTRASSATAPPPTPSASPAVTVLVTPSPTPRPVPTRVFAITPTVTASPTVSWAVPAAEIAGLPADYVPGQIVWKADGSLDLQDSEGSSYTIDPRSAKVISVATTTPAGLAPYSPLTTSKAINFEIQCDADRLKLFRLPGSAIIGQAAISVQECGTIAWAKSETAASIVDGNGNIYVWRVDGSAPYRVGQTRILGASAVWSPDSTRLVAPVLGPSSGEGSFVIAYADGRPMRQPSAVLDIGNGWDPSFLQWITTTVIENMQQCGDGGSCLLHKFYDAQSGHYLIGYMADSYTGEGQTALVSPNFRWLALDTDLYADQWDQRYSGGNPALVVYDLTLRRMHVWAQSDGSFMFDFWMPDSKRLLIRHYPTDRSVPSPGPLPYGILAVDPQTLQTDIVVRNVVSTNWNSDRTFGYMITADVIEPHQASRLQGAIYTVDGQRVTALQALSDQLEFDSPADSVSLAWSGNGRQVVVGDASGNLWLQTISGTTSRLGSDLPVSTSVHGPAYRWSPDDTWLLVYRSHRAWIIDMGASHQ